MEHNSLENETVLYFLMSVDGKPNQMTKGAEPQQFEANGIKPIVWAVNWPMYVLIS